MATLSRLLKDLFPFKGYKISVLSAEAQIIIGLKSRRKTGNCPICNRKRVRAECAYERRIRDLDFGPAKCFLVFDHKKLHCRCGFRGMEKLEFVSTSKRVSTRLAERVAMDCESSSLKDVALRYDLDWKTVKEIDREYILKLLPKKDELNITRIAIDEIAIMKGHKYFSILRDYDTGVALKIYFGRGYEETSSALAELGEEKLKKIKRASLDMWDPYIKAVKENCPNAELVFDKFHVVKKVNDALDKVRRKEFSDADKQERLDMKHKRWIILSREDNLNREQTETLNALLKKNNRLFKAYLLKEQILTIFDDKISTFEQIKERIRQWMENLLSNELEEFKEVLGTIQNYLYGILNYFRYGMTNAIAEGFNTKINILKRRAFGFRDLEYFALKIYQSSLKRLS